MATCLVTGGAGFIGSHLVEALVARGDTVRVLDDLSTGDVANLAGVRDRITFYCGDVRNRDLLRTAAAGVDRLFHLAGPPDGGARAQAPPPGTWARPSETLYVLAAAREAEIRRVVCASSCCVYGRVGAAPVAEFDRSVPVSQAGFRKLFDELHCLAFTALYGVETVRLRYSNTFGPRQGPSSAYARAVPAILKAMLAGESPALEDEPTDGHDFIYVDDVVHATVLAAEAPRVAGGVYNIARGRPAPLTEVVGHLNQLLGTCLEPVPRDVRPNDFVPRAIDISRVEQDLGFCPSTDLRQGLMKLLEYQLRSGGAWRAEAAAGQPQHRGPHFERRGPLPIVETDPGEFRDPGQP
jgi:UDP-N-acetylglucosamine/UDP-N-acetyl-alpha-D-glucosaminouronate 4-epimerase